MSFKKQNLEEKPHTVGANEGNNWFYSTSKAFITCGHIDEYMNFCKSPQNVSWETGLSDNSQLRIIVPLRWLSYFLILSKQDVKQGTEERNPLSSWRMRSVQQAINFRQTPRTPKDVCLGCSREYELQIASTVNKQFDGSFIDRWPPHLLALARPMFSWCSPVDTSRLRDRFGHILILNLLT